MDRSNPRTPEALLAGFGVPADAQAIWRVLLADPNVALPEVSRVTGLRITAIEPALAALTDAELVRKSTAPSGVTAIDPTLALETHIARGERELAQRTEEFAALRAVLPEFANQYARGRASDGGQPGVEVLGDLHDIRRQVYLASESASSDARSIYHLSTVEGMRDGVRADLGMTGRGVRCRSIVGPNELNDPNLFAELEISHAHGEQYRALPDVPTRLLIFDRTLAILLVDPADYRLGTVFVRVRSLVDTLILLFDHLWSVAEPTFATPSATEAPTGRQARTLELIAIGNTDERIARTLGVGARTISREVSDLKTVLGVSSRAEIAAAAVRRGWL